MEASEPGRILLIDDDPALGGYLTRVLTRRALGIAAARAKGIAG